MTELTIQLPPFPLPAKPRYGAPCNGCGWCCHSDVCKIGKHFFGENTPAPCPAMVFEEGRVKCDIVMAERELLETDDFGKALGIDQGCCSDDPCEYRDNGD